MATKETEWSLQKRLTAGWLARGLVVPDDEPLFLTAWEVMTSYRINDARRHWSEPAIDFVFLDRTGRMVVLELKREVRTPREAWSVLCQVTHRAHVLAAGYNQERLEGAYRSCHSGTHGRTVDSQHAEDLVEAHAHAFGQSPLDQLPGIPVRRLVMANAFGPSFSRVLRSFNHGSRLEVTSALGRYTPRAEVKRFLGLVPDSGFVDPSPIQTITPEGTARVG